MNFRDDVMLKPEYDSIHDDIYDDFFNRVLRISKNYNRIGGNFTSKNLAFCAEGLQEFLQHDGHMKLVLVPEFTPEDLESINKGVKNAHDVISECWISDFSEVKDKFVEDHTKALAWMLANDYLEIRIVVPVDRHGTVLPKSSLKDSQVFRRKTGIFWDSGGESISFSGNIDFDDPMFGQYSHFRVYRSWDPSEMKYLENDYEEFFRYWDGHPIDSDVALKTIGLPDAVRDHLLRIAPKSKSEIRLANTPRLRPYQKAAIDRWFENDCRGVFEMATGTGKTFTAIGCLDRLHKQEGNLMAVIVCPFDNLERQWQTELAKWGLESMVTSRNPKWNQNMRDRLATLELNGRVNMSVVITTYKTFCTEKFTNIVENSDIPLLLIADEVHNAGAPTYVDGLSKAYRHRLGLSATFDRYFDEQGTGILKEFFGGTVYELGLKEAIEKGFLVGYYYHPIPVALSDDEEERYRAYTRTIARLWNSETPNDKERLRLEQINRSRVIQNAESKMDKFKSWVDKHGDDIKYHLIYCSEKQMQQVKKILDKADVINREVTANNPSDPTKRAEIIRQLNDGLYGAIVANRVLDEGADIPSAKTCVILASTGNPKQFIQRRGRVLRKFSGKYGDGSRKEHATIYDFMVIPDMSDGYTEDEVGIEQQIVAPQIKRLEHMGQIAINRKSCMEEIGRIKAKFFMD